MARAIVMPLMGMYTEEGVLTAWLRAGGEQVREGDSIAEVTTEKTAFEVPAPADGIVHPMVEVGTNLKVEALMGYILADGEAAPEITATAGESRAALVDPAIPPESSINVGAPRASPAAKSKAAQWGIDLRQVKGSGPGGRIVEADIPGVVVRTPRILERAPMAGMRQAVADRLKRSLANAASTTLTREAEADIVVQTRSRLVQEMGAAPSYTALFIKLLATALRERLELNAMVEDDSIIVFDDVHVGFAVAISGGLVAPVIHNADSLPLAEIARSVREMTARAHAGRLAPEDVEGGTASISNLGGYGIDAFTPILNGAQSVILGVGRITQRAIVRNGSIHVGHTCVLSLTFDHRVADGAPAAQLLDEIVRRMNDEQWLMALV